MDSIISDHYIRSFMLQYLVLVVADLILVVRIMVVKKLDSRVKETKFLEETGFLNLHVIL